MEAGKVAGTGAIVDAVDALVAGGRREAREEELLAVERVACPTCGSWRVANTSPLGVPVPMT
jgi:hypothetical protein